MATRFASLLILVLFCVPLTSEAQDVAGSPGDPAPVRASSPSPSLLALAERFAAEETSAATARRRKGDPLWNGPLIGFAIGGGLGLLGAAACTNDFSCTGSTAEFFWLYGGIGAGAGLAVDALLSRQTGLPVPTGGPTGNAALRVAPILGPSTKGVRASFKY